MGTIDDLSGEFLRQRNQLDSGQEEWSDVKFFWVPDDNHGFIPVQQVTESDDNNNDALKAVRKPDNQVERVRRDSLLPANSARYDKHEDMAELGELNEATILHCLKSRYQSGLIYTYSGLFLVAVNPYKPLPIYTPDVVEWFKGQARRDRPPHIYAVADAALADLLRSQQNQSILITGESGAGKTENTKKVIQYLTSVTGGGQKGQLEEKILCTNPILEAFGNAQTGKFVRIEFDAGGRIVGADIERYLLEKSRVTHRSSQERSFHVFYQLLAAPEEILQKYNLKGSACEYDLLKGSNCTVASVDDSVEFHNLLQSFNTMGITELEQDGIFKTLAAILHLGNIRLTPSPDHSDQAEILDRSSISSLCQLLQVNEEEFERALLNPILRAGKETIKQSRDVAQVTYSIESLCRTLYERLFAWLVDRLNRGLRAPRTSSDQQKHFFIGVLDIAGFEIFDKNSFEQLCINYTNEKLQQFYNHHMFVQEQEEYKREHVEWSFTDFGLDLQPTIDLLERNNPVGVFACLDEDCIVPKANDRSFTDKLIQLCKNKTDRLEPLRFGSGFAIQHYAGKVEYNTEGWLDKNKDPVNDSLLKIMSTSTDKLVSELSSMLDEGRGAVVKKGLFRTVAQRHRESLSALMQQLHSTNPHFVRCIVPNKSKSAGVLEAKLVLDQLKCNGVFEGIRVCRKGYPGRVAIDQFAKIYRVLISDSSQRVYDPKELCRLVLERMGFGEGADYKIGISKTTTLDDQRDAVLTKNAIIIQTFSKVKIAKYNLRRRNSQNDAMKTIGECLPKLMRLKRSPFWQLFQHVRPLLNVARAENRISELERDLESVKEARQQEEALHEREKSEYAHQIEGLHDQNVKLNGQLSDLCDALSQANQKNATLIEKVSSLEQELIATKQRVLEELEPTLQSLREQMAVAEATCSEMRAQNENLLAENHSIKADLDKVEFERMRLCMQEKVLDGKLSEVEDKLSSLQALLSQEQEKYTLLQSQYDDLNKELASKCEECIHLRDVKTVEFENLRSQLSQVLISSTEQAAKHQNTIADLEGTIQDHMARLSAKEEEIREAQSQIHHLMESNQRLTDEVNKVGQINVSLEMTVSELNGKLTMNHDELQSSMKSNEELLAEVYRLKAAEAQLIDALDSKDKMIAEAIQKATEVEKVVCERNKLLSEYTASIEEYKQRLLNNQEELRLTIERLQTIEAQKALYEAQIKDDQKVISTLTEEHKNTERRLKEAELAMIEIKLNERPSTSLTEAVDRLAREGEERMAAIKEGMKLERRIMDLESTLMKSDNNTRILLEQLAAKERESHDLKKANASVKAEVHKERNRIDQLTRQLDSIKKSIM